MSSISLLLRNVYENEYVFSMNLNYSEPKIYTGAVDITEWSRLTKKQQKEALLKDWYVYYSFRDPKTQKLKRQSQIKGGANRFKDKQSRCHILNQMQKALSIVLKEGYDPYQQNTTFIEYLEDHLNPEKKERPSPKVPLIKVHTENEINISDAFKLGLETKERVLASDSFTKFKSRVERFKKWLVRNGFKINDSIGFCRICNI
jgi:hypothetical protein